jgi:hypothetical protein
MRPSLYYASALGMYAILVAAGCLLGDITVVFDAVSAIAVSAIGFFIPAILYQQVCKKFPDGNLPNKETNLRWATFIMVLGCINFVLGMFSTILTILGIE